MLEGVHISAADDRRCMSQALQKLVANERRCVLEVCRI